MPMKAGQMVSCKCHNDACQMEYQIILVAALDAENTTHEPKLCPYCGFGPATVTKPKPQRMIL
jgi:hypothetical protein